MNITANLNGNNVNIIDISNDGHVLESRIGAGLAKNILHFN